MLRLKMCQILQVEAFVCNLKQEAKSSLWLLKRY